MHVALLLCCSPEAADPNAQPAENFPYPAEYAYKPADEAAPHHSTPAAAEPIIEQEIENFPYPAEYAYHSDATHTTTQVPETEVVEEEEQQEDVPSGSAGVRAGGDDQPSQPAQPEAAKVTSATYTLEGETQQHSLTQRLREAIKQVVSDVTEVMPEAPPLLHDVLQVYADGWRWLMNTLFPKPLTPAEGERTSSRPAVAITARWARQTASNEASSEQTLC